MPALIPRRAPPPPPGYEPLSTLPGFLAPFFGGSPPPYDRIWHETANARLPMMLRHRNRWYFSKADVPAIARILKTLPDPRPRPKSPPEAA